MIVVGTSRCSAANATTASAAIFERLYDAEVHARRVVLAQRPCARWYAYTEPVEQNTKPSTSR